MIHTKYIVFENMTKIHRPSARLRGSDGNSGQKEERWGEGWNVKVKGDGNNGLLKINK